MYDFVVSDHRPLSFAIEAMAHVVNDARNDNVEIVSDWKAARHYNLSCVSPSMSYTDLLMKCKPALPPLC